MTVPTLITDLSTTAASNAPAGSDSPSILDDVQRAHGAFIAQLRDDALSLSASVAVSIDDFSGADDGAKLTAALAVANVVRLPPGSRSSATTVTLGANQRVFADIPGQSPWTVTTDNKAFVLAGAYSELHGVYVTKSGSHTKNLIEIGTTFIKADRAIVSNIRVVGAGNDGIQVINGNLGTLRDIQSISNGRDGLNFTTDTIDNNTWTLEGHMDLANNTRDGVNFGGVTAVGNGFNSRAHKAALISCQTNGRYGAYLNSNANDLGLYLEGNVTKDLYLDTYAWGNTITLTAIDGFNSFTEVTANVNRIYAPSLNADNVAGSWNKRYFSGRAGKGIGIYADDGTAGILDIEKTGVRAFRFQGSGSNAEFVSSFTNSNASFGHSLSVQGSVTPTTDNTRTFGTSAFRWSNAYSVNFRPGSGVATWTSGAGTPEGVTTGAVGSLYTRVDGGAGTTLYIKESGAGNTGWVAK